VVKKILGIVLTTTIISLTLFVGSIFADDSGSQEKSEVPTFLPTIAEMKKYPEFYQPFIPSKPIPESEMSHLEFTKEWILKNDVDSDPSTVKITFPASWLKSLPVIPENEEIIELNIPTRLLQDSNENRNPKEITVSLPNYYFKGLPTLSLPSVPVIESLDKTGSVIDGTKAIEYTERISYDHTAGDDITGARGRVRPYSHYNPQNEDFLTYHEIEFYGDTGDDGVEIISEMTEDDEDTKVWFAMWSNGSWIPSFDCGTLVDVGDTANYEFYTVGNSYTYCWIEYPDDTWYFDYYYDATTPSDYEWFRGSSELDTIGGLSETLYVFTYPNSIESLKTSTWQSASYVDQRLDWDSTDADQSYVMISATLNSSGLFFAESAYNY